MPDPTKEELQAFDKSSKLDVTLQNHHQVIALSQAAINMCLNYRFRKGKPELLKFKWSNPTQGSSLEGEMDPPTVELTANTKDRYYGANLYLNFKSGTFSYFSFENYNPSSGKAPPKIEVPVTKWSLGVPVRFDPQQLSQVPKEVRESIEKPESYTITQLIIDFTTAKLASSSWDMSTLPGINTEAGKDAGVKTMIEACVNAYLESLRGPGDHNILGYALTKGSVPTPQVLASITPTSTRLQTLYYKPLGKDAEKPTKSGLNAFLIKEMTNNEGMPANDIDWTGNWFDGSLNGTLVMAKGTFFSQYLVKKLAPFNKQILKAMNAVLVWTLKPSASEEEQNKWTLDENAIPGDDKYDFTAMDGGGKWEWSGKNKSWLTTGFGSYETTICETMPKTCNTVTWVSNSGTINLKVSAEIVYKRTVSEAKTGYMTSFYSESTYWATIRIDWLCSLEMAAVTDKGILQVRMTQGTPSCVVEIKNESRAGFQLFCDPGFKLDEKLSETTRNQLVEKMSHLDLVTKIAEDINGQKTGFVFPGGGVFDMKSPVFTIRGDLMIGLTYRLTVAD